MLVQLIFISIIISLAFVTTIGFSKAMQSQEKFVSESGTYQVKEKGTLQKIIVTFFQWITFHIYGLIKAVTQKNRRCVCVEKERYDMLLKSLQTMK